MEPDELVELLAFFKNRFEAVETRTDAATHNNFDGEYCLRWEDICVNEMP